MGSYTTAHTTNASRLIYGVRDRYRSFPAAMADVLAFGNASHAVNGIGHKSIASATTLQDHKSAGGCAVVVSTDISSGELEMG